jgi:tripartite-type tricarboxylate transporter receptor subunit TctC
MLQGRFALSLAAAAALAVTLLSAAAQSPAAWAQTYPTKPVTVIIPFAASA